MLIFFPATAPAKGSNRTACSIGPLVASREMADIYQREKMRETEKDYGTYSAE